MFETPHYVAEMYQKKEDLRVLRENVLLVVRDYNRLVEKITTFSGMCYTLFYQPMPIYSWSMTFGMSLIE